LTRSAEPLVLFGPGGFGRETAEVARAINAEHEARRGTPRWDLLGFLDDDASAWGREVGGSKILGGADAIADLPDARIVVCTGHPGNFTSKKKIVERLGLGPDRYATLVHPAAVVAPSCTLGEGTVVPAGVVLTADVRVGAHVGLMPQAVLTHDDVLEDFVIVGAGALLAGTVRVREGAYLGAGCRIRENVTIGRWALIGMGAVVTRDVPEGEVWAGVPAQFVRSVSLQ
jgi:sugar O-acyltransferase (sialic acid O-acetyltransferase NeuD family)